MPSKGESSAHPDCVPGICTHRPSLCSIGRCIEILRDHGILVRYLSSPSRGVVKLDQYISAREHKSRNKVAGGEPPAGSKFLTSFLFRVCGVKLSLSSGGNGVSLAAIWSDILENRLAPHRLSLKISCFVPSMEPLWVRGWACVVCFGMPSLSLPLALTR